MNTAKLMRAEMLDAETEQALARAWRDYGDEQALHRLVKAYLRLAIATAAKYSRRNQALMSDLIQEASVGLMKAASKFDPDRGVRFSTYAEWWIKAAIQEYLMRNCSLMRIGSTASQKRLFFQMNRARAKLERGGVGLRMTSEEMRRRIAAEFNCSLCDVEMMEGRLAGSDFSLNTPQVGEEGQGREWIEILEDEGLRSDESVARDCDITTARKWLVDAFSALTEREKMIVEARKLADTPETLESLGKKFSLSKERVRQLEAQALRKLKKQLEAKCGDAARELVLA